MGSVLVITTAHPKEHPMTELDTLRNALAQNIAGLRIAERHANQALIIADCQLRNLANQAHQAHLHTNTADTIEARVRMASMRVQAGLAAGTAQLGD
jgi:hypothetical protein